MLERGSVDARQTSATRVIWWAGLLLCTVQLLTQIADGSLREFYFISDHLYLPTLFEDLTRWSGSFADWRLTPAPYLFPDLLLYAAFRALGASIELAQYGSGIGLMLLIIGAARLAIDRAAPQLRLTSALLGPLFALWIALHTDRMVSLVAQLAVISVHGGAVLASFVSLALCFVTGKRERIAAWTLGLIAAAAGASDPLYTVSCSLPLLVLAAQAERAARKRYVIGAAAGIIGTLLARWLNARSTAGYLQPRPARSSGALLQLIADLLGPARIELALLTVMLALAIYLALRLPRDPTMTGLRALAIWEIASLLSTLVASVLTGRYSGPGTLRYLLVPFTFGVVLGSAALAYWLQRRGLFELRASRLVAIAAVTALIVDIGSHWSTLYNGQYSSDVRKQAACVAAIDPAAAQDVVLTDYWNAKPLRLMSGGRVRAVQMTEALEAPRWWINSRGWYRGAQRFGLVVTNDLKPDAIVARFGPPTTITHCDKLEVFVYRGDAQAALTHAMHDKLEQFLAAPHGRQ